VKLIHSYLFAALLAALMLYAQAAALVHQTDHDTHAAGELCEQCLVQTVFNGLSAELRTLSIPPVSTAVPDRLVTGVVSLSPFPFCARAPPACSS